MRKELTYYKVYDNEEKEYAYNCNPYNFFELKFYSIIDARSYNYGCFSDPTRYEIHKFTQVISSDCVNCDPPTEEDFKRRAKREKENEEYLKRRQDYINKFNPKDEERTLLEMSFDLFESMKELSVELKDNYANSNKQKIKPNPTVEINSFSDIFEAIENQYDEN